MFGGDAQNEKITLRSVPEKIRMPFDVQPLEGLVYLSMDRDSEGCLQKKILRVAFRVTT